MNREEKYLISICNAYLNRQTLNLDKSVDYSRLFSVCREQNLIAVAFSVIKNAANKDIVPSDIYSLFENGFYETIMRFDDQTKVMTQLDDALCKNKIRHVFFKGAEIRTYYPVPEVRAMGDIDVLIDEKNRDLTKQTLLNSGFEIKNANGPVFDYIKDGVLIEVHTKIISGKVGNSNAENGFLDAVNYAEFDEYRGKFDPSYHFAYLITHIAHHFWFYGAGIKLILDLAVMERKFDIDYDEVLAFLDNIGLCEFAKLILTVCNKWFGSGKDYGIDTSMTEEFLSSFGAFGNANRNTAAVVERKELESGKKPSKFKTKLRLLFPSYTKMKDLPYIKFINGRPCLLPLAWICRIFYNLKHRRDFVASTVSEIGTAESFEAAQRELDYFKEIGLL